MPQPDAASLGHSIRQHLETLGALRPSTTPRTRWTEPEVVAFEQATGVKLCEDVRTYLVEVGEAPAGFWSGRATSWRELPDEGKARLSRPFPLERAWADSGRSDPLPAGATADDGTVTMGCTSDGRGYLLVGAGPRGGEVWTDNRGNDFGEVLPAGRFLTLLEAWARDQLDAEERFHAIAKACAPGDLAALKAQFSDEQLRAFFDRVLEEVREGRPSPPGAAWCLFEHARSQPEAEYEAAGQALVLAGAWERLHAFSEESLALLAQGRVTPTRFAEMTFKTHLAIASVALERPLAVEWPGSGFEYSGDDPLVPMALRGWSDQQLRALFARLRTDQPLWFLAQLRGEALGARLGLLGEVVDATAARASSWTRDEASTLSARASNVLKRLGALAPSPALTEVQARVQALHAQAKLARKRR